MRLFLPALVTIVMVDIPPPTRIRSVPAFRSCTSFSSTSFWTKGLGNPRTAIRWLVSTARPFKRLRISNINLISVAAPNTKPTNTPISFPDNRHAMDTIPRNRNTPTLFAHPPSQRVTSNTSSSGRSGIFAKFRRCESVLVLVDLISLSCQPPFCTFILAWLSISPSKSKTHARAGISNAPKPCGEASMVMYNRIVVFFLFSQRREK